jgi:hypothetical protein
MFDLIPNLWGYAATAVLAIVAFLGAFIAGRRGGRQRAENKALRRRVKDMKTATEVRDEVDAKTDAAVRGDLGRWVRPE